MNSFYANKYFAWGYDGGTFNSPTKPDSELTLTFTSPTRDVVSFRDELFLACQILKEELEGERITLSVSGGSDSLLVSYVMNEVGIDFIPIHAIVRVNDKHINSHETHEAIRFCQALGKELLTANIDYDKQQDKYIELVKGQRFVHFYRFVTLELALQFKDYFNIAVSGDVIFEALLGSEPNYAESDFRTYCDLQQYSKQLGLKMFNSFYKIDPHLYYSLMVNPEFFLFNAMYPLYKSGIYRQLEVEREHSEPGMRFSYGNFIKHYIINKEFPRIFPIKNKLFSDDIHENHYYGLKDRWIARSQFHPKFNKELSVPYKDVIALSQERNTTRVFTF